MPSRSPSAHEIPAANPALRPARRRRAVEDRVRHQQPAPAGEDRVTSQRLAPANPMPTRREPAPFVLPPLRQVLALVAPTLVTTMSVLLALLVATSLGNVVWFIVPLVVPGLVLAAAPGAAQGVRWREAVAIDLATMLILFPLLIIRQNAVRVPYLDAVHGTAFAAALATAAVLTALVSVALVAAWVSREAPESATMLFLPAALLVPMLSSASEFARLDSALLIAAVIFLLSAGLTLVASVMPPAYVMVLAPLAVATEVLFVALVRQDRIFPVGANQAGMVLFAGVVVAALALVVVLPSLSAWMNRVDRFRQAAVPSELVTQP